MSIVLGTIPAVNVKTGPEAGEVQIYSAFLNVANNGGKAPLNGSYRVETRSVEVPEGAAKVLELSVSSIEEAQAILPDGFHRYFDS